MSRIQGKTISDGMGFYAGIDISKAALDVWIKAPGVSGCARRFGNTPEGIAALIAQLGTQPHRVVFEPTGRFHHALWQALDGKGHATIMFNPWRARKFAEFLGKRAKTDTIDARVLAEIACHSELAETKFPPRTALRIKELQSIRQGFTRAVVALKNQLCATNDALATTLIEAQIALVDSHRQALDVETDRLIASEASLARHAKILTSIPGFGAVSTRSLIADLPELGLASDKQIAALVGVAPFVRESGFWRGRARTQAGRAGLRQVLYMATVATIRCNPTLQAFYKHLRANGKPGKVALIATLRKLLILANALIRDNRTWSPQTP